MRPSSRTAPRVVVVGAGPSGLAALVALRSRGVDAIGVDRSHVAASSWADKGLVPSSPVYDSLRLNNSSGRMRFRHASLAPGRPYSYQSPDAFRRYLHGVIDKWGLEGSLRLGRQVRRAERARGARATWRLTYDDGSATEATHVVLATGMNARPHVPAALAQLDSLSHSASYAGPHPYEGQRVLVVGSGNTGADIACDLVPHAASVDLACSPTLRVVPRSLWGFPLDRLDGPVLSRLPLKLRATWHELALVGTQRRAVRAGLSTQERPLLDDGWTISSELIGHVARGSIRVRPKAVAADRGAVVFDDGAADEFDWVILATGYAPSLPALPVPSPVDRRSNRCFRKIAPVGEALRGVFFVGAVLPLGPLLPTVEAQADWVAAAIESQMETSDLPTDEHRRFGDERADTLLVDPHPYIRLLRRDVKQMATRGNREVTLDRQPDVRAGAVSVEERA